MSLPGTSLPLIINNDLYLRQAAVSDAAAVYKLIDSQRPYLREWLPFVDMSKNVSVTALYLQTVTSPANTKDQLFVMVYKQEIAGLIGFKEIDTYNRKLEIGYWLSELLQGKGIVLQSCKTIVKYAFEKMNMNRIQIRAGVGNVKSSNIAKKLNFTFEGIQREAELLNGKFHDLETYSLLRSEWKA